MAFKYATIDIEATGLSRFKEEITFIGIGLAEERGLPIKKYLIYDMSDKDDVRKCLNTFRKIKDKKIKCVWQNGKFDTLFIEHKYGVLLPIDYDTLLLGNVYDMAAEHGLKKMAYNYLGVPDWDVSKKEKTSRDRAKVEPYLRKDVQYTWELCCFFVNELWDKPKQVRIYKKLLLPAYKMYRRAEKRGIYINLEELKEVADKYYDEQKKALKKLTDRYDINWNSPAQVSEALYGEKGEGLPILKTTDSGNPSSDAATLKRLKGQGYEIAEDILNYKFYNGAITKFIKAWPEYAKYDGRIHPHFNISDVRTGRTSCSDPNLQQVPRNPELRNRFGAPKGRKFIEADYSQIELRGAAHYSKDPVIIEAYREGKDLHMITALGLTGKKDPSEVTKEERSRAKPVNFGFLYGMGAGGFVDYAFNSYNTIFTREEAEYYRDRFFMTYPRLLEWHEEQKQKCLRDGGVYDLFGRFRALPDIYSKNPFKRSTAERCAINTPVQGTCSNILVGAATQVDKELGKELGVKVVGTVHDAMLLDFPEECEEDVVREVGRIMCHPKILDEFGIELLVPIVADVGVGAWGIGH